MMTHRLLQYYLDGKGNKPNKEQLEALCRQSSNMERRAMEAERTSVKYKQVEFMSDKIGMVFDGVISGVTEWGLYVELKENMCEGMVPLRDLKDDYYELDEKTYSLIGKANKHRYRLGDPVRIKVVRVNLDRKIMDFTLEQ
jgi:ribonuclease R